MTRWWAFLLLAACTTRHGDSSVYGRPWTFVAETATIDRDQSNGDAWDPDLSPPDAYARIYLDGQLIGTTQTVDDSYTPHWSYETSSHVIERGQTISIDLVDSDTFDDDPVFINCEIALTPDVAANGAECDVPPGVFELGVAVD